MNISLADSVLNRLLNFADELDAPLLADPNAQGAALDRALAAPTAQAPADPVLADAMLLKGLGLEPPP